MVRELAERPEKPDRVKPSLGVKVPVVVRVPEPERVPVRETLPPSPTVGLAPKGKVQSLETVLVPVVWAKVTVLKVTLLQARVASVSPPTLASAVSKITAPELWVKSLSVMDKVSPIVIVPVGAVKEPEEKVKSSPISKVVYELKSIVAPSILKSLGVTKPLKPD